MLANAPSNFSPDERAFHASRQEKARLLAEHGAIGTIMLGDPRDEEKRPWALGAKNWAAPSMRLRDEPRPMIFVPYQQHLTDYAGTGPFYVHARMDFAIRTEVADAAAVARAVRQIVTDVDSSVAVDTVIPMRERLFDSAANDRFWLRLLGLFGALAVFLATVGIYGVIAYAVEQRAHEFSIRTAMGAGRRDIVLLVVREGLLVTVIGIVIGLGAALGLTRLIASQLYDVTPTDPLTMISVVLLLIAIAMLACVIPARHAASSEPLKALRVE